MMFRCLVHFDALLAFCGNGHCLPIRVGNLVWMKRARFLASHSQLFAYQQTLDTANLPQCNIFTKISF